VEGVFSRWKNRAELFWESTKIRPRLTDGGAADRGTPCFDVAPIPIEKKGVFKTLSSIEGNQGPSSLSISRGFGARPLAAEREKRRVRLADLVGDSARDRRRRGKMRGTEGLFPLLTTEVSIRFEAFLNQRAEKKDDPSDITQEGRRLVRQKKSRHEGLLVALDSAPAEA